MKVLNVHSRVIAQPIDVMMETLSTLATPADKVWPFERWPRMQLDKGLKVGSTGGHGPIGYRVKDIEKNSHILFEFTKPSGFKGIHRFDLEKVDSSNTRITHTINMDTKGSATLQWLSFVRPLHDALTEDAFDKVENLSGELEKTTPWTTRVKVTRKILTRLRGKS